MVSLEKPKMVFILLWWSVTWWVNNRVHGPDVDKNKKKAKILEYSWTVPLSFKYKSCGDVAVTTDWYHVPQSVSKFSDILDPRGKH